MSARNRNQITSMSYRTLLIAISIYAIAISAMAFAEPPIQAEALAEGLAAKTGIVSKLTRDPLADLLAEQHLRRLMGHAGPIVVIAAYGWVQWLRNRRAETVPTDATRLETSASPTRP